MDRRNARICGLADVGEQGNYRCRRWLERWNFRGGMQVQSPGRPSCQTREPRSCSSKKQSSFALPGKLHSMAGCRRPALCGQNLKPNGGRPRPTGQSATAFLRMGRFHVPPEPGELPSYSALEQFEASRMADSEARAEPL